MRRSITSILRQLGARDVAVSNSEATFSALVPTESATPIPPNLQIVPARWDKVTLDVSIVSDPARDVSDPMSVFAAGLISLFTTRNISHRVGLHVGPTTPHRGTTTLEVLRPVEAASP